MDWSAIKEKIGTVSKKYRYAMIVLLIGVLMMLLPTGLLTTSSQQKSVPQEASQPTLDERLSALLSRVYGAGEVQVMLTLSCGEETLYQSDTDLQTQSDSSKSKYSTVTVTDSQRNESGLVRQVNPPIYKGAVVICQGADNMTVRLAIVEAVSKATGLGADKISVLKMK